MFSQAYLLQTSDFVTINSRDASFMVFKYFILPSSCVILVDVLFDNYKDKLIIKTNYAFLLINLQFLK